MRTDVAKNERYIATETNKLVSHFKHNKVVNKELESKTSIENIILVAIIRHLIYLEKDNYSINENYALRRMVGSKFLAPMTKR